METVGAVIAGIAAIATIAWLEARVRRLSRRLDDQSSRQTHQKYIGLDEYRARQQRNRYKDRVS